MARYRIVRKENKKYILQERKYFRWVNKQYILDIAGSRGPAGDVEYDSYETAFQELQKDLNPQKSTEPRIEVIEEFKT